MRIAVLASHGGSLLQTVIDACQSGAIAAHVVCVISNNRTSGALARAAAARIPHDHLSQLTHTDADDLDRAIADVLALSRADLVLLAGYMKRLGPVTLERFRGKLVNTHPALLPKYGGQGFYGKRVHAAVLAAGESESGATVHFVEGDYDTGPIIAQQRVAIRADDTVEVLQERVKAIERKLLIDTLATMAAPRVRDHIDIRVLCPTDIDAFRRIRLNALEREPTAFSSSYETELHAPPDKYRERMSGLPESFVIGAFSPTELVGIAGFHREIAPKRHHAAAVTGMYVDARYRGQGIARRLLQDIISHAARLEGLEQVELSVTATNVPARNLYAALGFRSWGVQPSALKVDGMTYDEEHMVLPLSKEASRQ